MTTMFPARAALFAAALALGPGAALAADDRTVDPAAYTGLWYEIARTPTPYQEQCEGGVTALYELIAGDEVRVVNRCDTAGGEVSRVEGTAEEVGDGFRRFEVQIGPSPDDDRVNYVVEAVGPVEDGRHAWAAVSDGDGGTGWILAARPELDDAARDEARAALEDAGVDVGQLQDTSQPPENYDPDAD
jgi:apolipoprotein D and lipocalin family protein